jgi:hypothetical protein
LKRVAVLLFALGSHARPEGVERVAGGEVVGRERERERERATKIALPAQDERKSRRATLIKRAVVARAASPMGGGGGEREPGRLMMINAL